MSRQAFDWDQYGSSDFPERVKFEQPGTLIAGVIVAIQTTDFGGQTDDLPELHIESGGRVYSVVATQARLLTQLAEKQPQVGDRISITYIRDGTPKRPGFNPPKFFSVEVTRAAATAADQELDPEELV
jgi:hypothetical protein